MNFELGSELKVVYSRSVQPSDFPTEMLVWFVKTRDNLSDILTKALGTVLHKEIRDKISAGDPNGNLRTEMMETFNLLDNRSKDTKHALTCMILQSCLNETRMIFRQD